MELIEIGIINNTHGIRGELKFTPWCDSHTDLLELSDVVIDDIVYKIISIRPHKDKVLLMLEGVTSIDMAEGFKNKIIYADKDAFTLDEDRYFVRDLIGICVTDVDSGFIYGTLYDIIETGANDVYCVRSEKGREYLIPAIEDCIISVDLEKKSMQIRPLEGLFD
ncbi:MAG: ribosome maturation factor RimM [Clostridia bacterium]